MNPAPPVSRRLTAAVVLQSLLWLWLLCLSVLMLLGYFGMSELANQQQVNAGQQRLETLVNGLAQTTHALQERPAPATAAALQETRQTLEARIAQVEQSLNARASTEDLQALRAEVEQIKAQQAARIAEPRPAKVAAKPVLSPLPFRVIGAELRAGQASVSVAPATGDFKANQVQVLLPGDAVGQWRLQAVEGNTAVFQAGEQTRRVAIP